MCFPFLGDAGKSREVVTTLAGPGSWSRVHGKRNSMDGMCGQNINQITRRSLTYEVFVVVKVRVVEYPTVSLVELADPALPTIWAVCHRQAPGASVHQTEIRETQSKTHLSLA